MNRNTAMVYSIYSPNLHSSVNNVTKASYYIYFNNLMSPFFLTLHSLHLYVTLVNYFTFVNILPTFIYKLNTKYFG